MPKRGQGFSTAEVDHLLDQLEDVLPLGSMAWGRVLVLHETKFPSLNRTIQSLQRKFSALYNHKMPTGDPNCPEQVRKAKRIYRAINEKMDVANGEVGGDDDDEEYDEDFVACSSGGDDDDDGVEEGEVEQRGTESGLIEPHPEPPEGEGNGIGDNAGNGRNAGGDKNGAITRPSSRSAASRPPSPTNGRPNQTTTASTQTRQATGDKNPAARKMQKTSAFSTPIVHSRRDKSTPGSGVGSGTTTTMYQEMMQMMMVQREIDSESDRRRRDAEDRRREAEELRHRQMMDMFMMNLMANTQRNQAQYMAPPPVNNYGVRSNMPYNNSYGTMGNIAQYGHHTYNAAHVFHPPGPSASAVADDFNNEGIVEHVEPPAAEEEITIVDQTARNA